jgi:c-di-GMP-binding flagellar brake protein YcgR
MSPLEMTSFRKVKLQLWEKLELEFGRNRNIGMYFARVQDFRPDGIVIDRPLWLSGEPTFDAKEPFLASIFREDGAYQFNARIVKTFKKGNQKLFVIKYPETLYRRQRRNYCRVESNFAVHFRLLRNVLNGRINYEDSKEYYGTTVNVSASGILINSMKVIKKDDLIAMTMNNQEIGIDYPLMAIVRRIVDLPEGRINAGIEFLTDEAAREIVGSKQEKKLPKMLFRFNERERQRLVQYVFGFQIKLRKKGLI